MQCHVVAAQGPTISPVYTAGDSGNGSGASHGFYACTICVPKKRLYPSVKELRKVRSGAPFSLSVCNVSRLPWLPECVLAACFIPRVSA